MRKALVTLAVSVCVLGGCQRPGQTGYTFTDISLNSPPLPQDLANRTVIKNSVDFRLNPSEYIGEVISPNGDGTYSIIAKPLLAQGSTPAQENFQNGQVYDANIDQGASAQGSYLSALTASLSGSQTATVSITDAVHAYVPPSQYPDDQIFALAATNSTVPRYWLAELYISTVTNTISKALDGTTNISATAFSANGKVYQKNAATAHDFIVGAKLIDVDAYARVHNKPSNGPQPVPGTVHNQTVVRHGGSPRAPAVAATDTVTFAFIPPIQVRPEQPR